MKLLTKIRAVLLLALLVFGMSATTAQDRRMRTTVDEALAYFQSLRDADVDGFLVGQFGGYGAQQSVALAREHFEQAAAKIGDCPAMTGWDLWNSDQSIEQSGDEAFAHWQAYPHLFYTLSAHLHNPWTGGKADDITGASRLRELLSTSTAAGRTYHDYLDRIAAQLQRFEDASVVILWRPLHEANGGWFWWGAGADADYVALWRHMRDYFTRVKGLSNLIWVYAPNARFERFDTMYPGDTYVDMVGLDYYKPLAETRLALNRVGEYDFLAATGKPFYLTEFGARPASGAGWDNYFYDHAITLQAAREYPALIGALYWEYVWRIGYNKDFNQSLFVSDPLAVTCSDLPAYLFDDTGGGAPQPTSTPVPELPTSTPTATPSAPADGNVIGADGRFTIFEAAPRVGNRISIRVETTLADVRYVELYQGATWLARDRTAPYTFALSIDPAQPVRVRANWGASQFLADYSLAYYMGAATSTPAPSATRTPTATVTPSATAAPSAEAFDLIVCIAEASSSATLTADSVVFDRDACIVRP